MAPTALTLKVTIYLVLWTITRAKGSSSEGSSSEESSSEESISEESISEGSSSEESISEGSSSEGSSSEGSSSEESESSSEESISEGSSSEGSSSEESSSEGSSSEESSSEGSSSEESSSEESSTEGSSSEKSSSEGSSSEGDTNIALNKTTYQTDTQTDRVAALAVDGDPGTCSVTSSNDSSWEVDLGEICPISHVIICCVDSLNDLELYTGDGNDDYELRSFVSEITGSWISMKLATVDDRWVKITRTAGQTNPLMLCEVEMFVEDQIDLTNYTVVTKTTVAPDQEKTEMRFEVDSLKQGTGEIIETKLASSKQQCCFRCLVNTGCKNANYHHGDGTCTLLSSTEYVADVDDSTVMFTPDRD